MGNFEETIEQLITDKNIIKVIFELEYCDQKEMIDRCQVITKYQHQNKINLFSEESLLEIEKVELNNFFIGQDYFSKIIPLLNVPLVPMMQLVTKLVNQAGKDMSAYHPNQAFREWCEKQPSRSNEVILLSKTDEEVAKNFLFLALEANSLFADAIEILKNGSELEKIAAVMSIGRMELTQQQIKRGLIEIEHLISNPTSTILATNAVSSAFELWAKSDNNEDDLQDEIITHFLNFDDAEFYYMLSRQIPIAIDKISERNLDSLLIGLLNIEVKHSGSLNQLDYAFKKIFGHFGLDKVEQFIHQYIVKHSLVDGLSNFKNFINIIKNNDVYFSKIITSWIIDENGYVRASISKIFKNSDSEYSMKLLKANLPNNDKDQYILAARIVGYWGMSNHVIASSFLFDIIEHCDKNVINDIEILFYDYIYINYHSAIEKFLKTMQVDGTTAQNKVASRLLVKKHKYLSDLSDMPKIKEFSPTENQRQLNYISEAEMIEKAYQKASEKSVFKDVFTTQTILYGTTVQNNFIDFNGKIQSQTTEMQTHNHSVEVPRIESINPMGLQIAFHNLKFGNIK